MGLLFRENRRQKSKALPSAPLGISATCPASEAAEPRGAREARCGAGCHAAPGGKGSCTCEYRGERCGGIGIVLSACAGSEVALGEQATAEQSSFSQLKL